MGWQDTMDDTIRMAYVGLFHKFESFLNGIMRIPKFILGEDYPDIDDMNKWIKQELKINLYDYQITPITFKINWISNCIKHKEGLPVKEPKPLEFLFMPEDKKIVRSVEEFKADSESLIKICPVYVQILSYVAIYINFKSTLEDKDLSEKQDPFIDKMERMLIILKDLFPAMLNFNLEKMNALSAEITTLKEAFK